VLNFPTGLQIFKSISMIYFCVKTDEFLASILDKVSLGAQYYCQFDVPLAKAESIIEKLKKRYVLDQTARQRNYRMQQKLMPVVDLVVLLNQSLYMAEKVRLCLLCTMPVEMRPIALNCSEVLRSSYQLEKSELDHFFSVLDRKNRLFYMSIANPLLLKSARDTLKSVAVYELVQIPYTLEQRKQKNIPQNKAQGWTWRLHKEFMSLKKHSYQMCLRNSNRIKKIILVQDEAVKKELQKMWGLCGFRGVRQCIFDLNRNVPKWYISYFNRKSPIELIVPPYKIKSKRLVSSFNEALMFHKYEAFSESN
jgi:hypothetical protein